MNRTQQATRPGRCPACITGETHSDAETQQYHPLRWDYEQATKKLPFTKEFNSSAQAMMDDPLAPIGQRVLAWIKRKAWGNYCLYAIHEPDGEPAYQRDCAAELGIDKRRVSQAIAYYEMRGYLEIKGKLLYPVVSPVLGEDLQKVLSSPDFLTFYKVAYSADFQLEEVLRSQLKAVVLVRLGVLRKWRKARTNGDPLRNESFESGERSSSSALSDPAAPGKTLSWEDEAAELAPLAGIDVSAALQIIRECRTRAEAVSLPATLAVIWALWKRKHAQLFQRVKPDAIRNVVGLMIKSIPNMIGSDDHRAVLRELGYESGD